MKEPHMLLLMAIATAISRSMFIPQIISAKPGKILRQISRKKMGLQMLSANIREIRICFLSGPSSEYSPPTIKAKHGRKLS
ncbi:MAG TPA: hypothetical protein DEA22_01070 [Blastocatellia bacterium]|nr:hypothetical protein [Blastocatellia bacterium]